jgi:hypothetical protein
MKLLHKCAIVFCHRLFVAVVEVAEVFTVVITDVVDIYVIWWRFIVVEGLKNFLVYIKARRYLGPLVVLDMGVEEERESRGDLSDAVVNGNSEGVLVLVVCTEEVSQDGAQLLLAAVGNVAHI